MGNINREMETLRKNQKEMLHIKDAATKMKNAFVELIRRLSTAEERKESLSMKNKGNWEKLSIKQRAQDT